jgi:hypothetical protein
VNNPRLRGSLTQDSFGPQELDAELQTAVVGQDAPVFARGNSAEQHVDPPTLNATAPAKIEKARGFFEIAGWNGFV